jgi:hypothetical protein
MQIYALFFTTAGSCHPACDVRQLFYRRNPINEERG